jgi:hypothetical protein
MKLVASICLIVFTCVSASAQENRTWLGFDFGASSNQSVAVDFGTNLQAIASTSAAWGAHIRQDFKNASFVEAGFLRNNYTPGYYFKSLGNVGTTSIGKGIRTMQIPLRLGTRLNIYKHKWYLVPVIGYAFGINLNPNKRFGSLVGTSYNFRDTVNYIADMKGLKQYFSLIQSGLNIECNLNKAMIFCMSVNYYGGFHSIAQTDLVYHSNRASNSSARIHCNGSNLNYGIALKLELGLLWSSVKKTWQLY